ncbi:hypothetical protein PUATCC27989T_00473 [Phytobacter ursingii]|nr:hypothetical protein PUATCC27989T_00473 [Phytobacter ursingii]
MKFRAEQKVSKETILNSLIYIEETGEFFWKETKSNRAVKGSLAGCTDGDGYRIIRIGRVGLRAHRIAWLMVYGDWPDDDIDHINRVKSDNRISNLRVVTNQQNQINKDKGGVYAGRPTSSKYKGVSKYRGGKWRAHIKSDGKFRCLGHYKTEIEAFEAYKRESINCFGCLSPYFGGASENKK